MWFYKGLKTLGHGPQIGPERGVEGYVDLRYWEMEHETPPFVRGSIQPKKKISGTWVWIAA